MNHIEIELRATERTLSQFHTLTNRLNRYWARLVREALKEAKQRGLVTKIVAGPIYLGSLDTDILIRQNGDRIDASELLKYAKNNLPSLHRRFKEGERRHEELSYHLNAYLKKTEDKH